jgi:hypothetical protein
VRHLARSLGGLVVVLSIVWWWFDPGFEPAIAAVAGVASFLGSFYRTPPTAGAQQAIGHPPYEVGGTDLGSMKADPVIGPLINDRHRYYWARPESAGSAYKKGYTRFHTSDGRPCVLAREGLWLMVKRAGADA